MKSHENSQFAPDVGEVAWCQFFIRTRNDIAQEVLVLRQHVEVLTTKTS
jgi:hypothetical protein